MTPRPPNNATGEIESLRKRKDTYAQTLAEITEKYVEKIEELSLIRRLGDAFKDITDFPGTCKSIVTIIKEELDPENCSLMLLEEDRGELVLRAAKGSHDHEANFIEEGEESARFRLGESIAGLTAKQGESILVQDVLHDGRFLTSQDTKVGVRSLICLPLVAGERIIGVLSLSHNVPNAFNENHERILAIIANSSAIALENTRLYKRLSESRDRLAKENVDLKNELIDGFSINRMIGSSREFREVLLKVQKVLTTNVNVLITGESGTGKELIARTLHYNSPRSTGPFVAVNCAALPENLLESELFGIEKGVATGVEKRAGKFELANGGTIFLDEIGDMSLSTQAKILRVIQERELQRVGGKGTMKLDVRVVSATNKDLVKEIREERFREDLYYRLKVVQINIPPLRERKEDIPLLANHFLRIYSMKHGVGEKWFSKKAVDFLANAPWRGNVRELENIVEQAVVLSEGQVIGTSDFLTEGGEALPEPRIFIPDSKMNLKETMRYISEKTERSLILKALEKANNNKSKAAKMLGIGRRTLIYKLKKLDEMDLGKKGLEP